MWRRYAAIAAVVFGVPMDDAWRLTVREFWALMDIHLERSGKARTSKVETEADMEAFIEHLQSLGVDP